MTMIEHAKIFGRKAHEGQTRKYTGDPYWTHTEKVGKLVAEKTDDIEVIIAGYLHDVIEDTDVTYGDIVKVFGHRVAFLVQECTNVFTSKAYPDWTRAERKDAECARLGLISLGGKLIKQSDMEDNTSDILKVPHEKALEYLKEKQAVMTAIK